MRRQAIENLRAAIEANTERRSLDQLKAQGKRHVRVVSGEKVMQIIKAIVSDIVDREVGELTERDRENIVAETKQQFDRVLRMQTDQDALLQEQKDISTQYKQKFEEAEEEQQSLTQQLEQLRKEQAERESKLSAEHQAQLSQLKDLQSSSAASVEELTHERDRLTEMLEAEKKAHAEREDRVKSDYEARIKTLKHEQKDLVSRVQSEQGAAAGRQEKALAKAQGRAEKLEEQVAKANEDKAVAEQRLLQLEKDTSDAGAQKEHAVERAHDLDKQVNKLEARLENCKVTIENNDREIERLQAELAQMREKAGQSDAVAALQGQLANMQTFLQHLDEKSAGVDEATVGALMAQLSQRESMSTEDLENRFNASLDASLDKISKTMEAATAKPIDIVVEATDVLVDKLFDGDYEMTTNLDELEVEKKTSTKGIAGSLAALKKMRGGLKKKAEESASGDDGGGKEPETAPSETKKKMNASVERLKAVRGGEENKS